MNKKFISTVLFGLIFTGTIVAQNYPTITLVYSTCSKMVSRSFTYR